MPLLESTTAAHMAPSTVREGLQALADVGHGAAFASGVEEIDGRFGCSGAACHHLADNRRPMRCSVGQSTTRWRPTAMKRSSGRWRSGTPHHALGVVGGHRGEAAQALEVRAVALVQPQWSAAASHSDGLAASRRGPSRSCRWRRPPAQPRMPGRAASTAKAPASCSVPPFMRRPASSRSAPALQARPSVTLWSVSTTTTSRCAPASGNAPQHGRAWTPPPGSAARRSASRGGRADAPIELTMAASRSPSTAWRCASGRARSRRRWPPARRGVPSRRSSSSSAARPAGLREGMVGSVHEGCRSGSGGGLGLREHRPPPAPARRRAGARPPPAWAPRGRAFGQQVGEVVQRGQRALQRCGPRRSRSSAAAAGRRSGRGRPAGRPAGRGASCCQDHQAERNARQDAPHEVEGCWPGVPNRRTRRPSPRSTWP